LLPLVGGEIVPFLILVQAIMHTERTLHTPLICHLLLVEALPARLYQISACEDASELANKGGHMSLVLFLLYMWGLFLFLGK